MTDIIETRNSRKTRVGIVVSDKMDKTIVVAVSTKVKHPLYKKTVKLIPRKATCHLYFLIPAVISKRSVSFRKTVIDRSFIAAFENF